MNETPSDKKPIQRELTRIPVKHIYWQEPLDVPGNPATSNTKCYQDPPTNIRYWTAVFIPAWNQIELTFHNAGITSVMMYTMQNVRKWELLA